jgi:hypothetical protein
VSTRLPSVFDLANQAGLIELPRYSRAAARGGSPCCGGTPRDNHCSYDRNKGVWHCFKCGVGGGTRDLAQRLGVRSEEPSRSRDSWRRQRTPKARINVARAWDGLQRARACWTESIARWAREARGWSPELARAVADLPDVAFARATGSTDPSTSALIRRAHDVDRNVLIAIRCHRGVVRSVERRAHDARLLAVKSQPKSLALSAGDAGTGADWGGVRLFGSIPLAVRAARYGEPVYLCEGGPDFLALSAVASRDGRGVALGAPSASELPKVASALAVALENAGVPAEAVTVVCVPDRDLSRAPSDPAYAIGERKMREAAEALRGRALVSWVELPVGPDGKGDLSDVAYGKSQSGIAIRTALATRTVVHPLPVNIETSADHVGRLVARTLREANPVRVVSLVAAPGTGKTHLLLAACVACLDPKRFAASATPLERNLFRELAGMATAIVIGLPTVAQAQEKAADLRARFPGAAVAVESGALRKERCPIYAAAHPSVRARMKRVYARGGRRAICGRGTPSPCPRAASCRGAAPPRAQPGAVTFVAHTLATRIGTPEGTLVVLDESPPRIRTTTVSRDEVRSLFSAPGAVRWQSQNPDAARLARRVISKLDEFHEGVEVGAHTKRTHLNGPTSPLSTVQAELSMDSSAVGIHPTGAPPAVVRVDGGANYPDPFAWWVVELLNGTRQADSAVSRTITLAHPPSGPWVLEIREPLSLPMDRSIVVLDATADLIAAEWESVAALGARDYVPHDLDVVGARPTEAIHLAASTWSTPQLGTRDATGKFWFYERSVAVVRRALDAATRGLTPTRIGVLTHKPLADALRCDLYDAGTRAGDHALSIAALVADLRVRGWEVCVGHFGSDARATNRFEDVSVLLVLGDPRENLGEAQADATALGLDPTKLYRQRTNAAAYQAVHRCRFIRRAGVHLRLVYAGVHPPPLTDVVWECRRSTSGPLGRLDVAEAVAQHAEKFGALCVAAFAHDSFPPRTVARRINAESRRRGWTATVVSRRNIYAPNSALAREYARRHLGAGSSGA